MEASPPASPDSASGSRAFDFSRHRKLSFNYIVGATLAFFVVFSLWCGWDAFTSIVAGHSSFTVAQTTKEFYCNLAMAMTCVASGLYLRYMKGPVLGPGARLLLSLTLVLMAICVWELLEAAVRRMASSSSLTLLIIYVVLFVSAASVTFTFEYSTNYDVIGNHLLL